MSPLRRVWRSSWGGRLLIIAPYALVVAVGSLGLHNLEREAHSRCVDRQADRAVLRTVVDIATRNSGIALDLSKIPGFNDLDVRTQEYLRNLSGVIVSSAPTARESLHDQLLAKLPPIDC